MGVRPGAVRHDLVDLFTFHRYTWNFTPLSRLQACQYQMQVPRFDPSFASDLTNHLRALYAQ